VVCKQRESYINVFDRIQRISKIDLKLRLCAGTNSVVFWLRVQKLNSGFLFFKAFRSFVP